MNAVPHFRVTVPKGFRNKVATARGCHVFLTLPGQEEVELPGVADVMHRLGVDEPGRVMIEFLASFEQVEEE